MSRFLAILAITVPFIAPTAVAADDYKFRAQLTGDNEVPAVETDTEGRAEVRFTSDGLEAAIRLEVRDGVRVTQAHLHCAPEGENGPIVAFLAGFHELGWDLDGRWIDDATLTDDNVLPTDPKIDPSCPETIETLRDIGLAALDGNIYVNVHTVGNAGGEVRGQLEVD